MDDNASRRSELEEAQRRPKLIQSYRRRSWKFLQSHKKVIFTSFLLLLSIVLLFGIFSQLQPPSTSTTPGVGTAIEYSTFIEQVKAGNVQAVTIRGNEINGLLEKSLKQTTTSTTSQASQKKEAGQNSTQATRSATADYAAWSKYVGNGNNSGWAGIGGTAPIDVGRSINTRMPASGDEGLMPLLLANNVLVTTRSEPQGADWGAMFWRAMPFIVVVVLLLVFFVSRNNNRSTKSIDERVSHIGKSRARRFVRTRETPSVESKKPATDAKSGQLAKTASSRVSTDPGVTFADVAGIDEVRAELEEIVQFLRAPERFNRLGARIPRGALLVGPPGTGKTLLARAVAGEANVPFFSMSASEFVEMFVGVGASRVRDLFNQARQVAPCVIFLDEIDAVGRKRTMRVSGNDERDQTLNQLLVELDGFDGRQAVVVMAATNRVDILDKALLRPGRFDRKITVSSPDRVGREAILRVHARQVPLHEDVSLERLSRMTVGMTGADLANLVNEAALSAARRDQDKVDNNCFEEALARVQLGALRPIVLSEKEKRIIAVHEGGHALVAHHLPEADSVNRVTILPRGQSLGVTQFVAEEDRYNYSREMLMARIAVGLGGRVAEELTFGSDQITTGAENDFQVVTDLARRMVTRWGMSEQLGVVFADQRSGEALALNMQQIDPDAFSAQAYALILDEYGNPVIPHRQPMFMMEAPVVRSTGGLMMQALIDTEVQRILNEGCSIARAILTEHNDQLLCLADALIEYEQLDRSQFEALVQA